MTIKRKRNILELVVAVAGPPPPGRQALGPLMLESAGISVWRG